MRTGLVDRYDTKIHKITLHSFRSWRITKCNRIDSDFGNALGGHEKYMKRYNRFSDAEKCELFIKAEKSLSIFERVDVDQLKKIDELESQVKELQEARNIERMMLGTIIKEMKINKKGVKFQIKDSPFLDFESLKEL